MNLENRTKLEVKYKNLIQMLRGKRESLDLTQEEIADKCGVSFTNISAIERGIQVCNSITLIGYMEAVGISFRSLESPSSKVPDVPNTYSKNVLSSFFECISEEEQMKIFEDIKKSRNINSELLELISSLSEEKQESLASFASFLIKKK